MRCRAAAPACAALAVAIAFAAVLATPAMASPFGTLFAGTPPATLGAPGGRLAPCPDRPNCVSSQAGPGPQAIAPLTFQGDPDAAMKALAAAIATLPGATIVTVRADYVHAEFASAVMGFVDDGEFALDAGAKVIHVRSAARLGHSDFGVNRQRIETLRAAFAARSP
jgi:uncharacterized protein (DUF1499 family)